MYLSTGMTMLYIFHSYTHPQIKYGSWMGTY